MKLFEKIKRFVGRTDKSKADRVEPDKLNEYVNGLTEKIKTCFEDKTQEELKRGFDRAWIPEPWPLEGAPKTDPETLERIGQMPIASLEDVIAQVAEGMTQVGVKAEEAAVAIQSAVSAGMKPEPLSHLTNNWRKMHGLPMRRRSRRR